MATFDDVNSLTALLLKTRACHFPRWSLDNAVPHNLLQPFHISYSACHAFRSFVGADSQ